MSISELNLHYLPDIAFILDSLGFSRDEIMEESREVSNSLASIIPRNLLNRRSRSTCSSKSSSGNSIGVSGSVTNPVEPSDGSREPAIWVAGSHSSLLWKLSLGRAGSREISIGGAGSREGGAGTV